MDPIIVTKHLYHTYQLGPVQKAALVDINMEIERGSCVAIIGVTGSGKSTLARLMAGLYEPTSGRISFDGKDLRTLDRRSVRNQLGIVTQEILDPRPFGAAPGGFEAPTNGLPLQADFGGKSREPGR